MTRAWKSAYLFTLGLPLMGGLGEAAQVRIDNQTSFAIEVSYSDAGDAGLLVIEPGQHESVEIPDGIASIMRFKNISSYSDEARQEMREELAAGLALSSSAAAAVCTIAPLLAPPIAILGLLGTTYRYYANSAYYHGCTVTAEQNTVEIRLKANNKRSFYIEKRLRSQKTPSSTAVAQT